MPDAVAADVTADPAGMLGALMAVGIPIRDGMRAAADILGVDAALTAFDRLLDGGLHVRGVLDALDGIADCHAGAANDYLCRILTDGRLAAWEDEDSLPGIYLGNRDWIQRLPEGLRVWGDLFLHGCTQLRQLPPGLDVSGSLTVSGCPLPTLPDDLQIGHSLDVSGCWALETIPTPLRIPGDFYASNCAALMSIPDGVWIGGGMFLAGCHVLTAIPRPVDHAYALVTLSGCAALTELPEGFRVAESLDMKGCVRITRLPKGLDVGWSIYLETCSAWDGRFPQDARIGQLVFTECFPDGLGLDDYRAATEGGDA